MKYNNLCITKCINTCSSRLKVKNNNLCITKCINTCSSSYPCHGFIRHTLH